MDKYALMKQQMMYDQNMRWLFVALAIWSLVWKGFALYKAARRDEKWWFIAMLILNTAGLLEIFYIFVWVRMKSGHKAAPARAKAAPSKKKRR